MARDDEAMSRGRDADDDLLVFAEPDDLQDAPYAERDYGDEFELPDGLPTDEWR